MAKYRQRLPQLEGGLFLTDGGLETTLIFHNGVELPHFAAFDLLRTSKVARCCATITAPTSRRRAPTAMASFSTRRRGGPAPIGARRLGYSTEALAAVNRDAISLMVELRDANETPACPWWSAARWDRGAMVMCPAS